MLLVLFLENNGMEINQTIYGSQIPFAVGKTDSQSGTDHPFSSRYFLDAGNKRDIKLNLRQLPRIFIPLFVSFLEVFLQNFFPFPFLVIALCSALNAGIH
ncbi:hypothetical protein AVEN_75327-1 [Araneus ventricosus]|uniref:Uncharacterized protein n=1 Tax=Araneus ventricosus TaxID=182803 RepID=A0A4Y2PLN1_ARAVE|nr:hypothetical protein AVEN_226814-1 [Araneus ventricosus]GBN52878.1 hypothetical protein AVEN_260413-1 [Araneus ventricosus]GBN52892.1 hypothetical protein AVEN_8839-1 [Araneus ventricosus]GBN52954.1 hypothetical protein AVEN_75327-1 [Araneus ventricosus]